MKKLMLRGIVAVGLLVSLVVASPASAETNRTQATPKLPANYVFAHEVVPGTWTGQCEVGSYFLTIDVYTADWYDLPVPYEAVADYYSGAVGNLNDPGYPQGSVFIEQYNWEADTGFPYPPFETPYVIHSDEYGLINASLNGGSSGGGPTLFAGRWTNTAINQDIIGHQLVTFQPAGSSSAKCYIVFGWGYEQYWQ
jgi:hypothetical protein